MENLIKALQKIILLLQKSESSIWSSLTVDEVIRQLQEELQKAQTPNVIDKNRLSILFGPTGSIQEISMRNNWANEYIEISKVIDEFTEEI